MREVNHATDRIDVVERVLEPVVGRVPEHVIGRGRVIVGLAHVRGPVDIGVPDRGRLLELDRRRHQWHLHRGNVQRRDLGLSVVRQALVRFAVAR